MRTAALRHCFAGIVCIPLLSHAVTEYRIKSDHADLFRTRALLPPPIVMLDKDAAVSLMQRGPNASEVRTAEGTTGWLRNADLLAAATAPAQSHELGDQKVFGDKDNIGSFDIHAQPVDAAEILPLDRSFRADIPEAMDKEQVEMRHDDN